MMRRQQIMQALFPHLQTDTPDMPLSNPASESFVDTPQDDTEQPSAEKYANFGTTQDSPRAFINTPDAPQQDSVSPMQDGSGLTRDDVKSSKQTWEQKHPEFQYPNAPDDSGKLTSQQSAENALAKARYQREHLENQDHGVKGVLRELLANFAEGLSHARPGMGLLSSLALGGVGAGAGAINRTWNEQRNLDQYIPQLEHNVDQETTNAFTNEKTRTIRRDDQRADSELIRKQDKDIDTSAERKRRDVISQYNKLPAFDPNDADNADFVAAAKEAGVPVPAKTAKSHTHYITDAKTGKTYADIADEAGNRKLVQLTNDDGTDFSVTTPQMMTTTDKKEQRDLQERIANAGNVTKVKVAEIGAGSREAVANTNQAGALERVQKQIQGQSDTAKKQLVLNTLSKWQSLHLGATPDETAAAQKQIEATVYNQ